ncbi:MAG: DUF1292 domain-containing protein [Clostridia bacterium]|nr:DUF1292 domain-containing protein [Clostridia bacterium]
MEDNIKKNDVVENGAEDENAEESYIFTLTDEDGNEIEFEMIGQCELNGQKYFAMIPVEDDENSDGDICEYGILKLVVENGEEMFVSVDDDDELDDVADYFDDLFSSEIDYDAQ